MKRLLYTVFHFVCTECGHLWETVCKSDIYCALCRGQGNIVSQSEVREYEDGRRPDPTIDNEC